MFLEWAKDNTSIASQISDLIKDFSNGINMVFKDIQLRSFAIQSSNEAEFQAYAGRGVYTMSHQSARMGIPAI